MYKFSWRFSEEPCNLRSSIDLWHRIELISVWTILSPKTCHGYEFNWNTEERLRIPVQSSFSLSWQPTSHSQPLSDGEELSWESTVSQGRTSRDSSICPKSRRFHASLRVSGVKDCHDHSTLRFYGQQFRWTWPGQCQSRLLFHVILASRSCRFIILSLQFNFQWGSSGIFSLSMTYGNKSVKELDFSLSVSSDSFHSHVMTATDGCLKSITSNNLKTCHFQRRAMEVM